MMRAAVAAIVVVASLAVLTQAGEDSVVPDTILEELQSPDEDGGVLGADIAGLKKNEIYSAARKAMQEAAPGAVARAQAQVPTKMFRKYSDRKALRAKADEKIAKTNAKTHAKLETEERTDMSRLADEAKYKKAGWTAAMQKEKAVQAQGQKKEAQDAKVEQGEAKEQEIFVKKAEAMKGKSVLEEPTAAAVKDKKQINKRAAAATEVTAKVTKKAEKNQKGVATAEVAAKKQWHKMGVEDEKALKIDAKHAAEHKLNVKERTGKKEDKKYTSLIKWKKESIKKEQEKLAKLEAKESAAKQAACNCNKSGTATTTTVNYGWAPDQ